MKKLLLVHAPGLSAEQACRGDMAANLSDLIADGSFARLSEKPDVPGLVAALPKDGIEVMDAPYKDMPSFDSALDRARARASASGASLVVLSEAVFVSQNFFPEIKVGASLAPADLSRFLSSMAG